MQEKIKQYIEEILKELELPQVDFVVELPKDISNGDYSVNVALKIFAEISSKSHEYRDVLQKLFNINTSSEGGFSIKQVAEIFYEKLKTKNYSEFSNIEIAGPGFINFYLSKEYFESQITKPISNIQTQYTGKKIITEYTDPNPFKQFHIGHLMSNTIGESVSRLYELGGAEVTRVCYQGDIGPHVAKCIWGMIHFEKEQKPLLEKFDSIKNKMKYLGDAYVLGSNAYEDISNAEEEIKEINAILYQIIGRDNLVNKADFYGYDIVVYYNIGRQWSLEYFDTIYKKLGTEFKHFFFESDTHAIGKKIVEDNTGSIFEKSEESDAIIYKGEKDGLHTRVFINSQGLPTYEAKEIGLAFEKEKLGNFDTSVVVTASEQADYFKVLLSVLSKLNPAVSQKMKHVTHGMMQFADGKMSSRKGNVITADTLLEQIEEKVKEKIADREYSEDDKKIITEVVSVGALKYSVLKQTPGKNIIFDFEKSISFEGDSGPYIQYAYTRALSVLNKASSISVDAKNLKDTYTIEKLLIRFESVITRAINELAPQLVANYLVELAGEFNSWYANEKILGDENEAYKLLITKKVTEVLKEGLNVLGIRVTGKM